MFSFRDFIKRGFLNAVGKLADYQVILNAAGWYDKGVLLEADLAEIQSAIETGNAATVSDAATENETSGDDTPSENGASGDDTPSENATPA